MENRIAKTIGGLMDQTSRAIGGLQSYEQVLNITTVSAAALSVELTTFRNLQNDCNAARSAFYRTRATLRAKIAEGRDYAGVARDILKPRLGKEHSALWIETGFLQSLALPRKTENLLILLGALAAHFTAHPERENDALDINAGRARSLLHDINTLLAAVNAQATAVASAITLRNQTTTSIKTKLRALRTELSLRMDAMDERYLAFGLNRPGQLATPEVPRNVVATVIAPDKAAVEWEKAPRAKHYRLWKRVVGVDTELVPAGSPSDPDFTLESLPANSKVELAVSAVNPAGESAKSEIVVVEIGINTRTQVPPVTIYP